MLQLNADQIQRLRAIVLQRDVQRLCDALSASYPDIAARLGERFSALVAHGVQRAAAQGLDHAVCVARYLACWFMLGAEFETKPGFGWALAILSDPRRPQGAKAFQLCRRTREELARLAQQPVPVPGVMAPVRFTETLAALDAALADRSTLGGLWPGALMQLGEACDIDAIDVRLVDAGWRQHYTMAQGQWTRVPCRPLLAQFGLSALGGTSADPAVPSPASAAPAAPTLPAAFTVLAQAPGGAAARVKVRTRAAACCDPLLHPLVTLNSAAGQRAWRGPQAAEIDLALHANASPPIPVPADRLQPAIAVDNTPDLLPLGFTSCGLRVSGASLGEPVLPLAVYSADQHLLVWRREAGAPVSLPAANATPADAAPTAGLTARCRVERDGQALDATPWVATLQALDVALAEGLGRVLSAWERDSGVEQGRLTAEPVLMAGTAGLTWGWAEGPHGVLAAPHLRVEGLLDLVVCQLNLQLWGQLLLGGSASRLRLHCSGRELLSAPLVRDASTDLAGMLKPAQRAFRQPFFLQIEPLAHAGLALVDIAGPVSGALVGSAGLRLRTDGPGLQWFISLAIEPVSVALRLHDPLLGQRALLHPLLPAIKLLDWSLG